MCFEGDVPRCCGTEPPPTCAPRLNNAVTLPAREERGGRVTASGSANTRVSQRCDYAHDKIIGTASQGDSSELLHGQVRSNVHRGAHLCHGARAALFLFF